MNQLASFSKWTRKSSTPLHDENFKQAIVYTRVSSKEQADKNLSLDFQKRIIDEYAVRNSFAVVEYFGGTYESAKTDGRKEFSRMLEFIKKNKGKVSHILVYTLDRFSRTGGAAIKIAQDLREKHGVSVFAVTQPTDTSNASGIFQQNIHLLFSEFDNQLRKQRIVAGMKEKFERGIWCLRPPMGYDVVRINGVRKIVINEIGKKLSNAFVWKSQGMKNDEILVRLSKIGIDMYKQKLSATFSNPFYCGIIVNKMLDGKSVEGEHEQIISQELFLKVNQVREIMNSGTYGVAHKKESNELPLKVFMQCDDCGQGYTGYIIAAKNLWYYKCRTKGCCSNKNATKVNDAFTKLIDNYTIKQRFIKPLMFDMKHQFDNLKANTVDEMKTFKTNLNEVQKKLDNLDEDFYIKKNIPEVKYNNFLDRFTKERQEILTLIAEIPNTSSNLEKYLSTALNFASKLTDTWTLGNTKTKSKLQKLIFPEGVMYNCKTETFRTEKVNEVFAWIASVVSINDLNKKGQTNPKVSLSGKVESTGLEPVSKHIRHKPSTCLFSN